MADTDSPQTENKNPQPTPAPRRFFRGLISNARAVSAEEIAEEKAADAAEQE